MPNPTAKRAESAAAALQRAQSGQSIANDRRTVAGFVARGLAPADVEPRVNVFTYAAWRALGRQVRRGECSVHLPTFIKTDPRTDPAGEVIEPGRVRRRTAYVFHISQTDPVG